MAETSPDFVRMVCCFSHQTRLTVTFLTDGTAVLDGVGVFLGERLAQALFQRASRAIVRPMIPTGNVGGVRAELLDLFLNFFVEAGDQRGDQHDHADTEHHAEDSEAAAHFVSTERVHGLLEIFAVSLCHVSQPSARSASIGSRRAARTAG